MVMHRTQRSFLSMYIWKVTVIKKLSTTTKAKMYITELELAYCIAQHLSQISSSGLCKNTSVTNIYSDKNYHPSHKQVRTPACISGIHNELSHLTGSRIWRNAYNVQYCKDLCEGNKEVFRK